ncbi:hypothetical protein K3555_13650 [Leisingera sp. M527]|uniref:hypothetical protein n=1 Tax=Leisingera sp. M527 TaxID=2867014 RepID=UPI0021A66206|nr:hypothetical protein [Leisingera sp. M527]UWQ31637.1 hypothetical protein K3555_13650 [Leisingera sp. M527]
MNDKRELFEGFHDRFGRAIEQGFYLEASWYIYALIEDRLVSMLRQSGGVGEKGSTTPIKMLGPKIKELKRRAVSDGLLQQNLPDTALSEWSSRRNSLMHAMADGNLSQEEIDKQSYLLATNGKELVKEVSAAAMRLKKHRAKVS